MSNVVTLHTDKRWKAVIEYNGGRGLESATHYFEEVSELHLIIEHGTDWNHLAQCVLTLNRTDDGSAQNMQGKVRSNEKC
ncbi:hypothetical protein ACFOEZ_20200 [Tianweitania populi]|nr:hypothetical protein [Tianweitania populi]